MDKFFTANYVKADSNFGVFNIPDNEIENEEYSVFCVLLNMLQRGCPTKPSVFLSESITTDELDRKIHFVTNDTPDWGNLIKGHDETGKYPAKAFAYSIVPEYFPERPYLSQLLVPETLIADIVPQNSGAFEKQRVDFYLPQAKLVIEIDGMQHSADSQKILDGQRDEFLESAGIKVLRVPAKAISRKDADLDKLISDINSRIENEFSDVFADYDYSYEICREPEKISGIAKMTSAMRLQIAVLELLISGVITLENAKWKLSIRSREISGYERTAIDDLLKWLAELMTLAGMEAVLPAADIVLTDDFTDIADEYIKIDFSLFDIATGLNTENTDIVYVLPLADRERDYFAINTARPIKYEIDDPENDEHAQEEISPKRKALLFMLKNIFRYDTFRKGQERIIINALRRKNTVGILPTGSGKSLCYQMCALLQPCVSMCICPIKSLMLDQRYELEKMGINRVAHISSDLRAEEREKAQDDFCRGKYLITFMSPERFQSEVFRNFLSGMPQAKTGQFGYAVVDEVHCLSEWGHNFRVSYLNLIKTIRNYCTGAVVIGLTATASERVIKNILIEFGMNDKRDVVSAASFDRTELDFQIKQTKGNSKEKILIESINGYKRYYPDLLEPNGEESRCGIIFTPHVNGKYGCAHIASTLEKEFHVRVKYFSGQVPKAWKKSGEKWEEEKRKIQKEFKENGFTLLAATKAFGMGINKPNVRYTIHYGIPESLEALYQEAGRAGRDGEKAQCLIIFSKEDEKSEELIERSLGKNGSDKDNTAVGNRAHSDRRQPGNTTSECYDIKNAIEEIGYDGSDLYRQLFLFSNGLISLEEELDCANDILGVIKRGSRTLKTGGRQLEIYQKVVYHLSVMGIISDWTVDWKTSSLTMMAEDYSRESVKRKVLNYITAYELESEVEYSQEIDAVDQNGFELEILEIFWNWYNDNIVYSRKQALLDVYESCITFAETGNSKRFRDGMEAYFKQDDVVNLIGEIADRPRDYEAWFEVLKAKCVNEYTAGGIIMRLNRFLESYRNNTGLNFISGILHMIDNSFDSANGKNKLEQSLSVINGFNDSDKLEIIEMTSKLIAVISDDETKEKFAEFFIRNYEIDGIEALIYRNIGDNYSLNLIVKGTVAKLVKYIGENCNGKS